MLRIEGLGFRFQCLSRLGVGCRVLGFAALDSFRVQGLQAPGFFDAEFPETDVCLPVLRKPAWRNTIES